MPHDLPKPSPRAVFDGGMAESYDAKNSKLAPIADHMHFLVGLVLEDLPSDARILCVGVGTGAEILSLATARPGWRFVGVDPSAEMLAVCRDRLARAGVLERCALVPGYVDAAPAGAGFDAAVSILVAHFVPRADRDGFYRSIHDRLKPGGHFVSTEICQDLDAADFPALLKAWARVQTLMGATPAALRTLPETLRERLCVLSPRETEALLQTAGFAQPVQFLQAFLIRGWHTTKRDGAAAAVAGRPAASA